VFQLQYPAVANTGTATTTVVVDASLDHLLVGPLSVPCLVYADRALVPAAWWIIKTQIDSSVHMHGTGRVM